jgi:hypothetical protein
VAILPDEFGLSCLFPNWHESSGLEFYPASRARRLPVARLERVSIRQAVGIIKLGNQTGRLSVVKGLLSTGYRQCADVGLSRLGGKKGIKKVAKQINKPRKLGAVPEREDMRDVPSPGRADQVPKDLHLSSRASLADMAPSDIVFLDDFAYLREAFAPNFVAVLACPLCGSPGLITSVQYSGGAPIVCTSKVCPGLFRIVDETQIVALPPI